MGAKLTTYSTRVIKQQLTSSSFRSKFEALLNCLPPKEQQVVQIMYGLQGVQAAHTWAATAQRMGLAMSTCRTIHNRAIAKIVGYLYTNTNCSTSSAPSPAAFRSGEAST